MLGVSGTLVSILANNFLGYKSSIYSGGTNEHIDADKVGATVAADSIIAASVFKTAGTDRGGEMLLTTEDIVALFKAAGRPDKEATRLAGFVVDSSPTEGGVAFHEFTELLSGGIVSPETLMRIAKIHKRRMSQQIEPV